MYTLKTRNSLAFKYWSAGLDEFHRSLSIRAQIKRLRRFIPSLRLEDIDRSIGKLSGIRAQSLEADGTLVDDFIFESSKDGVVLHVRNAPSPGATSSLAIAKVIANRAEVEFGLR